MPGCSPGRYSLKYGATNNNTCIPCKAGKYSNSGAKHCSPCETGKFSEMGSPECQYCPMGEFSSSTGAPFCLKCPAGSYSNQSGTIVCTDCEAGKYSDVLGGEKENVCKECFPGGMLLYKGYQYASNVPRVPTVLKMYEAIQRV